MANKFTPKDAKTITTLVMGIVNLYDNENWGELKVLWEIINSNDILEAGKSEKNMKILSRFSSFDYLKENYGSILTVVGSGLSVTFLSVYFNYAIVAVALFPLLVFLLCDLVKLIIKCAIKIIERKRNVVIIDSPVAV